MIIRNGFEVESTNLHQICILGFSRLVLNMGGQWPWRSRSFGHFDLEFQEMAFYVILVYWSRPAMGCYISQCALVEKQGKSEGFESCDRPTVGKCPIWVKIGDVLYRVTLKFDGWPWKTIGHLSFAVSSFVQHFIAIGEFKLELQSGNTQFGSNLMIFRAVWPWNLTDDLQKQ